MDNGWREWSRHVLKELDRLNTGYEKLDASIGSLREQLAMLRGKAMVWGALAGVVVTVVIRLLFAH